MAIEDFIIPGASVIGDVANMFIQDKTNRDNRWFQAEQNEYNRQHAWAMFKATNDYNNTVTDPAYYMKRFKDAGLNPFLAYGNPQKVGASSVSPSTSSLPAGQTAKLNLAEASRLFLEARMQKQSIATQKSQEVANLAQANKTQAEADGQIALNNHNAQMYGGQIVKQGLEIENLKGSNAKLQQDVNESISRTNLNNEQKNYVISQANKLIIDIENAKKEGDLKQAEIAYKQTMTRIAKEMNIYDVKLRKIQAELAEQTSGMTQVGINQLPGMLIGLLIKTMNEWIKGGINMDKLLP